MWKSATLMDKFNYMWEWLEKKTIFLPDIFLFYFILNREFITSNEVSSFKKVAVYQSHGGNSSWVSAGILGCSCYYADKLVQFVFISCLGENLSKLLLTILVYRDVSLPFPFSCKQIHSGFWLFGSFTVTLMEWQ